MEANTAGTKWNSGQFIRSKPRAVSRFFEMAAREVFGRHLYGRNVERLPRPDKQNDRGALAEGAATRSDRSPLVLA